MAPALGESGRENSDTQCCLSLQWGVSQMAFVSLIPGTCTPPWDQLAWGTLISDRGGNKLFLSPPLPLPLPPRYQSPLVFAESRLLLVLCLQSRSPAGACTLLRCLPGCVAKESPRVFWGRKKLLHFFFRRSVSLQPTPPTPPPLPFDIVIWDSSTTPALSVFCSPVLTAIAFCRQRPAFVRVVACHIASTPSAHSL